MTHQLSIFAAAREQPDRLALLDGSVELTFRELAQRTEPLAQALLRTRPKALSLTPQGNLPSLLWLYAAFATGTPVLTLHARATEAERRQANALAGAAEAPPASEEALTEAELPRVKDEAMLVFVPTSGSTGTPRLVQLSRRAVLASAAASAQNLGWLEDDRWLLCLPLAHTGGLSIVARTLIARRALVLFEPGAGGLMSSGFELGQRIASSSTSLVSLVPSVLERLLDAGFTPPKALRGVLLGGSGCSPALARRAESARIPLLTSYGLTETASQVVTRRYSERFAPLAERDGFVSSGHTLAGVELKLVNERIALRTAALFSGYLGDSTQPQGDSTQPQGNSTQPQGEAGWLITQDLGWCSEDGSLFVRGRADDLIVTGGENVDPIEVEAALCELPGIEAALVFGLASARFGQVVAAAIVSADARLAAPNVLAELLGDRLAKYKLPREVARVEALPLTESGKLDRRACAELFGRPQETAGT